MTKKDKIESDASMAYKLFQQGDFKGSQQIYAKLIKDEVKLPAKRKGDFLKNSGLCLLQMNDYEEAISFLEASIQAFQIINETKEAASVKQYLGLVYYKKGDFKLALKYYEQVLTEISDPPDSDQFNSLRSMIGMVKLELGDYEGALVYLLEAISIQEKSGDLSALANSTMQIGTIFQYLNRLVEAESYTLKALEIYKELNNNRRLFDAYNNLGNLKSKMKNYDEALVHYINARDIAEQINDDYLLATILNNLGIYYDAIENKQQALDNFRSALSIKRTYGSKADVLTALLNIGRVQCELNHLDEALDTALEGLSVAQEAAAIRKLPSVYRLLTDIYEKLGDYPNAIEYLKLLLNVKDQIYTEESVQKIAEMQAKYETQKKEQQAELYRMKTIELEEMNKQIESQKSELNEALIRLRESEIRYELIEQELHKKLGQKMIGESESIRSIMNLIGIVAKSDSTNVLIIGESGTGKEIVARQIHQLSSRKHSNFCGINSAAIPESLFESEFFGHEKNAFTGADKLHLGWFEVAHKGTLFLDEIGTMPQNRQVKLLRVLEERKIVRVGSRAEVPIDVRVISATNINLYQQVQEKSFREDLYHRLATFVIQLPSLRERKQDIPLLVEHFVKMFSKLLNKRILRIDTDVWAKLMKHDYPGNIRELKNIVERAVILANSSTLKPNHFPLPDCQIIDEPLQEVIPLKDMEKIEIRKALHHTGYHISNAAALLGIERRALSRKMKNFGITRE